MRRTRQLTPKSSSIAPYYARMRISGRNILDEHGVPFVMAGFNYGHCELASDDDPVEDKAMGANTVRIPWRVWGAYGGAMRDGQDLDAPGRLNELYASMIVDRVVRAKNAGLKVNLVGDSDCGQGHQVAGCVIDGVDCQDFWTQLGLVQLGYFLESWDYLSLRLRGLVDFYEPCVEPGSVHGDQASTWALQNRVMATISARDPAALFIIAGYPNYQMQRIADAYDPSWAGNNRIILSGNLLDETVCNEQTLPSKIAYASNARALHNVPVVVQQIGTRTASDPDNAKLRNCLALMNNAGGGSIGGTVWEKVSPDEGSYGIAGQPYPGGPRTYKPARKALLQDWFQSAKVAAS